MSGLVQDTLRITEWHSGIQNRYVEGNVHLITCFSDITTTDGNRTEKTKKPIGNF